MAIIQRAKVGFGWRITPPRFRGLLASIQGKIIGAKNFIDVNRFYPGNHKITVIHIFELDLKVLTTVWIEADTGQKTFANSIFEVQDEKLLKVEEYWAEPYPAPRMEKTMGRDLLKI